MLDSVFDKMCCQALIQQFQAVIEYSSEGGVMFQLSNKLFVSEMHFMIPGAPALSSSMSSHVQNSMFYMSDKNPI